MTPAELATIEALANAATPGPWHAIGRDVTSVDTAGPARWCPPWCIAECMADRDESDAAFIASARQAVPALLAEVRRLHEDQAQVGKDYCDLIDRKDALFVVEKERLREENAQLRIQLDGSFGGISRNKIYEMGRAAVLMQVDAALATLARARDSAGGPLSSSDYEEFIAMVRSAREPAR